MNEQNTRPPILLDLAGIEDFTTAVAMLRATGARRWTQSRSRRRGSGNSRTFVIDHNLTAQQAAALIDFIEYGTAQGFLTVETHAGDPDEDNTEEWWETA